MKWVAAALAAFFVTSAQAQQNYAPVLCGPMGQGMAALEEQLGMVPTHRGVAGNGAMAVLMQSPDGNSEAQEMTVPNRCPCWTENVGPFAVTVSYMPDKRAKDLCGVPVAVFQSKRAKTGSWLEENQRVLSIVTSKLMQHEYRDDTES